MKQESIEAKDEKQVLDNQPSTNQQKAIMHFC